MPARMVGRVVRPRRRCVGARLLIVQKHTCRRQVLPRLALHRPSPPRLLPRSHPPLPPPPLLPSSPPPLTGGPPPPPPRSPPRIPRDSRRAAANVSLGRTTPPGGGGPMARDDARGLGRAG